MKRFNEKGASLGFCITAALLAAILLCALFVSCGRTHSGATGSSSGVGSGLAPTGQSVVGAHRDAPAPGGSRTAPTIALADVLAQIDAYPAPKGVDAARFSSLKAEMKRLLIARATTGGNGGTAGGDAGSTDDIRFRRPGTLARQPSPPDRSVGPPGYDGAAKTLSIAPAGTMNAVTDLKATVDSDGSLATLTWTEVLPGDYDNDGAVDITDIIPVALYYGQRTDSGPDDAHRLVSGDANPEINIWDLGAIAGNYAAHLEGYQVWRGHWNGSSTDWETTFLPNRSDPAQTSFSVDRPSPPPPSRRPSYWYANSIYGDADKNNIRYKVVPYGDGAAGAESNEAVIPATTFSVSGKVTVLGNGLAGVTLTLAPSSLHATSQADGTYAISGVANGAYTLTPTGIGYLFSPSFIPVTVSGASVVGLDFAASVQTYSVSGKVTEEGVAVVGVIMTLTPGGLSETTEADGTFKITGVPNGSYTLVPSATAKSFTPLSRAAVVSYSDVTAQDFTGEPSGLGSTPWPKFHGNAQNTGQSPYIGAQTNHVKWTRYMGIGIMSSPAIGSDGTVYIGAGDNNVYAINAADGSVKWRRATGGDVSSSPAVGTDGTVYIGSRDRSVYAISPSFGLTKWMRATAGALVGSPAIGADGTVYIGGEDHSVYALNPTDGSVKWSYMTGNSVESTPAIGADGTVYVCSDDSKVYALSPIDGSVDWAYSTTDLVYSSPAVGADGTIYVGGWDNVYALDSNNGTVKWTHSANGITESSPTIGPDGTVYVGIFPAWLYALDPADGSVKWRYVADDVVGFSLAIGVDGTVYVGSDDRRVYALNAVDGSVKWAYATGGQVRSSAAIGADGTLYIGSYDGKLYAFGGGPSRYIGGKVTLSGVEMAGVRLTLTPVGQTAVTQSDGTYMLTGVADGTYTLAPSFGGYKFTPTKRSVTVSGADVTGLDFTGRPVLGGLANSAWPKFRGNVQNTGLSHHYGTQTNAAKWVFGTGGSVTSSPSIGPDGTIFVGSNDHNVYALYPADGRVKWSYTTGDWVRSSPAIGADGTVYVGSDDGNVYALNPFDGSVEWSFATRWRVGGSPSIGADGTVYVGGGNGKVYALDPADGSVKWGHSVGSGVASSPAVGADGTVYIGSSLYSYTGYVYALDPADGSVKWYYAVGGPVDSSPAIGADGTVYIGSNEGTIFALNPVNGSVKWTYPTGGRVSASPAIGPDDAVYVGSYDHNIYALNSADGNLKWKYATGSYVRSSVALASDGTVYVGGGDYNVYALNGADGSLKWMYTTRGWVDSSPAIGADGTVYIGSIDGKLYAFGP